MTLYKSLENKKVLVLGMARSGYSVTKLLLKQGAIVTLNDKNEIIDEHKLKALEAAGVKIITGAHPLSLLAPTPDLIIKNPGIPYTLPLLEKAAALDIPIITEVELAAALLPIPIIGITGSNGKTTTCELTAAILRQYFSYHHVYLVGNIGVPLSEIVYDVKKDDHVVTELSSFQLAGSPTLHPHIAAITNIYSAHLDYHGTQEAYEAAKFHMIENQTEQDYIIFNDDLAQMREKISQHTKAQLVPFSRQKVVEEGAYILDGWIYFQKERILPCECVQLPGLHNLENVLVATAIAKLSGVSNDAIMVAVSEFHGVKHRTQFVAKIDDRTYYNDSKATNTQATIQALRGFQTPLVLIAGGLDRGNDMLELIPEFKKYVKALVTFGQTSDKMAHLGQQAGVKAIYTCDTVAQAVKKATEISDKGDIILLSPANASWDQYQTFEQRGDDFIRSVEHLKQKEGK
ncbi:UDP-N-acetylmuramoyl-L-alanine--D-glutamate ligase [Allofustis seminis]|uniref:UDP-N-acetylmuramoyl-L-alanine--D-glutamate ligase n=1 Tax=Allofustis seminis TaxID=166939 RepID=UPI00037D9331|nr:UDP-N-acetylmuramoyl-L-alanine--D-glutamate ligase [Allofustis seminis]